MSDKKIDFESNLSALEEIVKKLESGECTLDESISLFEKGMKHTKNCRNALKKAEKKITELSNLEKEASSDE